MKDVQIDGATVSDLRGQTGVTVSPQSFKVCFLIIIKLN